MTRWLTDQTSNNLFHIPAGPWKAALSFSVVQFGPTTSQRPRSKRSSTPQICSTVVLGMTRACLIFLHYLPIAAPDPTPTQHFSSSQRPPTDLLCLLLKVMESRRRPRASTPPPVARLRHGKACPMCSIMANNIYSCWVLILLLFCTQSCCSC